MNKRCTNPACRKVFSTLKMGGTCPHCGRKYRGFDETKLDWDVIRLERKVPKGVKLVDLYLTNPNRKNLLNAVRCIRNSMIDGQRKHIGLRQARAFLEERKPLKGLRPEQAEDIYWGLRELGYVPVILPSEKGTKPL